MNHHNKTIMDYSNLKSKTIFDFCEDMRILRFITKQANPNREEYLKTHNQEDCVFDLRKLAFLTKDDNLGSALFDISPEIIDWDCECFEFRDSL